MGAYMGCILLWIAIAGHGCSVKEAAQIQADATMKAAAVKCK